MFTEFYCNASTGSNMSGGSDENTSPSYTATNGGWNSGTGVFTPTSGDPSASVTVGQFAHVFADGSTTPTFIGRVTAVNSTTVTVSTTAKSGTAPGTAGSGVSINVGGVWKGPNGTTVFPFAFLADAMTNASGHMIRVNFKNNAQYDVTASVTANVAGPFRWEGYTSTVGDGGRWVLDGGTSGASYVVLNVSQNIQEFVNLIIKNNGATGSANGLSCGGGRILFAGIVVHDVRGNGMNVTGNPCILLECEAYACNQSNTANFGGITYSSASGRMTRCISHDNTGGNAVGFRCSVNGLGLVESCIADSNGSHGFSFNGNTFAMSACDAYNNGGNGININAGAEVVISIENCNLIKNGGYGIQGNTISGMGYGLIRNCGFGAGTQANTSGTTNALGSAVVSGSVTYAADVTPWVDPANGDFRISLAAAKNAGRGAFTETASSYSGTVGYPDIGAAQHQDSGGGGLLTNPGMGGGMRG